MLRIDPASGRLCVTKNNLHHKLYYGYQFKSVFLNHNLPGVSENGPKKSNIEKRSKKNLTPLTILQLIVKVVFQLQKGDLMGRFIAQCNRFIRFIDKLINRLIDKFIN